MHSADICCSMAMSVFKRGENVGKVLDAAQKVTHFGPGGRKDVDGLHPKELANLIADFEDNPFLRGLADYAKYHFMTQGDGNHFLYVGEMSSTGQMVVVTHHGSRGLGGQLYKRGKAAAERHTKIHAPRIPMHNAWIDGDSQQGEDYWASLQVIRQWTKLNHFAIHNQLARTLGIKIDHQMWNEHNFVFRKSDGLFYHAKGATPAYPGYAADETGRALIPLNMAEPILIVAPPDSHPATDPSSMGFAPHGAGRNMSRSAHAKLLMEEFGDSSGLSPHAIEAIIARETKGIDARFWTGQPDVSELPSAYKNAKQVTAAIEAHHLATIVDTIHPLGSMMAGEMNWNRRR
jgi:RNA-splicing ligase RtcB